jgi:hypothetical protein
VAGSLGRVTVPATNEETPHANEGFESATEPQSKATNMTIIAPSREINNSTMDREDREALLARTEAADAIARATKCDIPQCDGEYHEHGVPFSEGHHRVYKRDFDGLEVEINRHADGTYKAWICVDYIDDADATELRDMAVLLARYATELLEVADHTDELNKVAA